MLENPSGVLIPKGKENEIEQKIIADDTINAPIHKGQKIGEVTYTLNDTVLSTINIVSEKDVDQISLGSMSYNIFKKWFNITR